MTPRGLSGSRAVALITGLRLARVANLLTMMYQRRRGAAGGRTATAGKRRNRWIVSGAVALLMLFGYGNLTRQSIVNLQSALDPVSTAASLYSDAMMRGVSMEMTLLLVVVTLLTLGARELAQPDWDLEWLVTLPVPLPVLLWSRLLERTVASPVSVLTLIPAGVVLAWEGGARWSSVPVGALAVLPLLAIAAMLRTLIDTGLKLTVPPSRLRNLQAVLSVVSLLLLYSMMSLGLRSPLQFVLHWAREFPGWACWLPPGLVVRTLTANTLAGQAQFGSLLFAETAALLWGGVAVLERQLRGGVVAASSRETSRRPRGADRTSDPGRSWLRSPIQRRELRLLSRDRSFLVQTLVLPVVIVFSQLIIQGRAHSWSPAAMSDATLASVAFGIAAYTLMLSAFQTLNSEGGALWLLYTVPHALQDILAEKARLWAVLALTYPVLLFLAAFVLKGWADWELVGLASIVLLGVPIYTGIAVALGVFGCDPLAVETRARVRPTYLYLFTTLAALYTYAIFASEWSQRLVLIVLSGMLALALWQKARDELPYLLDPSASPPARVSTSDGIIGAMMFFVAQAVIGFFLMDRRHQLPGPRLFVAYAAAGAITYLLLRASYWRSKTSGVPRILGAGLGTAVALGAAAGGIAAAGAVLYLAALRQSGLMQDVLPASARALTAGVWIPILAILAAPLFEEFIFRGLIFGGLRRSLPAVPAMLASAAVFAIVHPPASIIPVFGLGLCAAFVYERTQRLLAPMLAHAVYNAAVVFLQFG